MRKFTISKNFEKFEYDLLKEKINEELPIELFEVLEIYAGLGILKNIYFDKERKKKWILSCFLRFHEIYNYYEDIKEELCFAELNIKLLSFANEDGGWKFCISTEKDYPVYIFKSSDYSGKDAFEKISHSFIEFINELQICENENN